MKYLIFSVILIIAIAGVISASNANSSKGKGIIFFKGSWKEAVQKAKQEKKPIFLDIYATWCGPCKLLKFNTFSSKEVGNFYNNSFINVSLDGEEGDGAALAIKYQISGYPSLMFFDKDLKPILYSAGYVGSGDFIQLGKEAMEKMK